MSVYEPPAKRFGWSPLLRSATAFGGLAILGYFVFQIFRTQHLSLPFKSGATAVIVLIGIAGAVAILQPEPPEPRDADGGRLYTAEEVAELLNLVRAGGGRNVETAGRTVATCIFCGKPDADVRGLDGTYYHRSCFQRAYRARENEGRRSLLR